MHTRVHRGIAFHLRTFYACSQSDTLSTAAARSVGRINGSRTGRAVSSIPVSIRCVLVGVYWALHMQPCRTLQMYTPTVPVCSLVLHLPHYVCCLPLPQISINRCHQHQQHPELSRSRFQKGTLQSIIGVVHAAFAPFRARQCRHGLSQLVQCRPSAVE